MEALTLVGKSSLAKVARPTKGADLGERSRKNTLAQTGALTHSISNAKDLAGQKATLLRCWSHIYV